MALTPENRANLEKLASYLERLPKRYRRFNMRHWVSDERGWHLGYTRSLAEYALRNGGLPECGSAACAVGHGPAAGVLVPPTLVDKADGSISWPSYSNRMFGAPRGSEVFRWCFDSEWAEFDNTARGAAARIRYLLANDGAPKGFNWPSGAWLITYASRDNGSDPKGGDPLGAPGEASQSGAAEERQSPK